MPPPPPFHSRCFSFFYTLSSHPGTGILSPPGFSLSILFDVRSFRGLLLGLARPWAAGDRNRHFFSSPRAVEKSNGRFWKWNSIDGVRRGICNGRSFVLFVAGFARSERSIEEEILHVLWERRVGQKSLSTKIWRIFNLLKLIKLIFSYILMFY